MATQQLWMCHPYFNRNEELLILNLYFPACSHVCHKECIEKSPVCKSSKGGTIGKRGMVKQTSEPIPPNSPPLPPRSRNKSEPVVSSCKFKITSVLNVLHRGSVRIISY